MLRMDVFQQDIIDTLVDNGKVYQCTIKLYHKILADTRKCLSYAFINRNITHISQLTVDTYILAFIKNI